MLAKMTAASSGFYRAAVNTGCHAFIEFTGLINEYIKICRRTMESGGDFTETNIHSGMAQAIESYEAEYIAQKLKCIYGTSLQVKVTHPNSAPPLLEKGAP